MYVHTSTDTLACLKINVKDCVCALPLIASKKINVQYKGCVKMFPPKTRADVGMVQCASEGHGKPPDGKTVGTRRRAGLCKKKGASLSTQNPGPH